VSAPAQPVAHTCRLCRRTLTALERLRGTTCGRLVCQHTATEQRRAAERAADLASRRTAAAKAWRDDSLQRAAVVWMQPHRTRLVEVHAAERREQIAHLFSVAEQAATVATVAEPASPGPALPGRVCAFCGGRCCRHGAFTHAFVDRTLLQRWVDAHPGSTAQDAAADYAARLPREHVEGSCLHHGRDGCTLPREMRSDICNRHACDSLVEARQRIADGAPDGLVVAMPGANTVQRGAWLTETSARRLTRRPRPT